MHSDRQRDPAPFERGTDGPKVIVTGVDGSDSSWRAVAYAAGWPAASGHCWRSSTSSR